ncbi:hypothetical protein CERZMDRAFT_84975 [Cercospora zeae-maydis SCOH1-5]|uniref:Uncharacterized protein n=1 Tax=Cercospora zeae-maydis SCOH1-5 TaxID=717836 RepID=A0A6A6FEX7_9PEZI|nr:hypothetical protein CERZMDRAFT_84975 [Cercospora zeae-maydis SCOH1-5]
MTVRRRKRSKDCGPDGQTCAYHWEGFGGSTFKARCIPDKKAASSPPVARRGSATPLDAPRTMQDKQQRNTNYHETANVPRGPTTISSLVPRNTSPERTGTPWGREYT